MITQAQIKAIMPAVMPARAALFAVPLGNAMEKYQINTPLRQAAFLAQIAHESGSLRYVREIASGQAYEGRAGLGNTEPGDGQRFRGRGLIQITGRANYRACSVALFGSPETLLDHPEMLETIVLACESAAWWWWSHGLNALADLGKFATITRRINGGTNGAAERNALYAGAQKVLAC